MGKSNLTKSVKASLLSGLVFPGLGHFYLKKYGRGALLAACAAGSLAFLIMDILERARQVAVLIQRGEVASNLDAISSAVSSQSAGNESQLNFVLFVLLLTWLFGVIDSYRAGRIGNVRNGNVPAD
jgi:hypothetical protein